jgi:hypothetical protein
MNERIKELAEQAKAESSEWLGSKPATTITYDELEKFALLIVEECSNVAHECILKDGSDFPVKSVAYRIKQHFGVKE